MKRSRTWRNRLLSPLIYLAALMLVMEDWCWDLSVRLVKLIAAWAPLKALERRIAALAPYPALCVFVLPSILLLPVRILALIAIATGHPLSGVVVIILARIVGTAVLARLYVLIRPALLTLTWFALWHDGFIHHRNHWIGRLKASDAYHRASLLAAMMRRGARAVFAGLRPRGDATARRHRRPARLLRRVIALWRARHR